MTEKKIDICSNLNTAIVALKGVKNTFLEENENYSEDITKILQKLDTIKEYLNRRVSVSEFSDACVIGRKKIIEKYISQGGDVNVVITRDGVKESGLIEAVASNNWDEVKILVEAGADLSFVDEKGNTALITAIEHAYYISKELIELLITKDSIEKANSIGQTPLCIAAENNNLDLLKILLDFGADINYRTPKSGWTPIMFALSVGSFGCARELMKRGAVLEVPEQENER